MDDANQIKNQNQNAQSQVKPQQDQNVTNVATSSSVGSVQKEQAPISAKVESQISEIIEASEKSPTIPTEVKEAGVEEVSDKLTLTDEHRAIGMEHAKESTPVLNQASVAKIMSEEEALKTIKTTSKSESKHWFAVLIEKIYKILKS